MDYEFYGAKDCANVKPMVESYGVSSPLDLYDKLSDIWCAFTCAPRLRKDWTSRNKTLGQCSITSFLAQDIFGGKVYGVPNGDGSFHCFNVVDGVIFDLTSQQFQGKKLVYTLDYEQSREEHFARPEKKERYLYLCDKLNQSAKR